MSESYSTQKIKKALLHFLTGKVVSGGLALCSLLLMIRGLPTEDFGAYTAFFAAQLILISLSSLGIEATTERFIPELRVNEIKGRVISLILFGVLIRTISLTVFLTLLWILSDAVAALLGLQNWTDQFEIYLVVILLAGVWQMMGACLEALMQQKASQVALVVNTLTRLLVISYFFYIDTLDLLKVIFAETVGISVGLIIVGVVFLRFLKIEEIGFEKISKIDVNLWARCKRFAIFNYSAQILMQGYGQDVLKLFVVRLQGVREAAEYGFSTSIMDMVGRYLPAVLLIRLIRPVFVSRYAVNKDFNQLNIFASIVLKLNLFLLAPFIAFLVVKGDLVSLLVSGGRYPDAQNLLVATALMLIPITHQWIISLLANTVEVNQLQFYGALIAIFGVPISYFLIGRYGAIGAPIGAYCCAFMYNSFAVFYLRNLGFVYRFDFIGVLKIAFAAVVSALAVLFWPVNDGSLTTLLSTGLICTATFIAVSATVKPFTSAENNVLSSLLPRKVLIF